MTNGVSGNTPHINSRYDYQDYVGKEEKRKAGEAEQTRIEHQSVFDSAPATVASINDSDKDSGYNSSADDTVMLEIISETIDEFNE